jgi:enamine deaminase RidA (YjgF/YER057c/UK114 family)
MNVSILEWVGWQFVEISCEARDGVTAAEQGVDVFHQAGDLLRARGLSLSDTIRTRIFGVDRPARDAVSQVRAEVLKGHNQAASSSYIAPKRFSSKALVALNLIAVRSRPGLQKVIKPYVPPKQPICFVALGSLLVLSGNTSQRATLEEQLIDDILPRIGNYLTEGGSSWRKVVNVSCYMHESQRPDQLSALFRAVVDPMPARFEICFVEGFSAPGKLVEVEVMAQRDG